MSNLVKNINSNPTLNTNQKIIAVTQALKQLQAKKTEYDTYRTSFLESAKHQRERQEKIIDAGATTASKEYAKLKAKEKYGLTEVEQAKLENLRARTKKTKSDT